MKLINTTRTHQELVQNQLDNNGCLSRRDLLCWEY